MSKRSGDYTYCITSDQSDRDLTFILLSKRRGDIVWVMDSFKSDNKLPQNIYSEYICKTFPSKRQAICEYEYLKELLITQKGLV